MKKLLLFVSALSLITLGSCSDDEQGQVTYGGTSSFLFVERTSNLPVDAEEVSTVEVEVGVTQKASVDRTFTISVDSESTATPDMYSIDEATFFIPANQFKGSVRITGNFDNIPEGSPQTLVLNLSIDGVILDGKDQHTVTLFRFCPSDLAGNYSVTTTYGYHDFLPTFASHTMNVAISAEPGTNSYSVADFSGGLYSVGPYCDQYGTCTSAANKLTFQVNCDQIVWSNQVEPYGPLVMDGASTYDSATGVLTIRWLATRWGEFGVSVYTPL